MKKEGPHFKILVLSILDKYMQLLLYKSHQHSAVNEFFSRENGSGEKGVPCFQILFLFIICKHIKMLCFKFHHNHAVNEEFDLFKGEDGSFFQIQIVLVIYMYMPIIYPNMKVVALMVFSHWLHVYAHYVPKYEAPSPHVYAHYVPSMKVLALMVFSY